jgi:hypothetical protein
VNGDNRLSAVWPALAAAVREAGGDWVPVKRNVWPNTADRLRKGMVAAFRPASDFEVSARRPAAPEPGQPYPKVDVWVRYTHEGGDE